MPDPQPDKSYWRLIDPIWKAVSIYDGPEAFLRQFGLLRPEVGHLFAAHWCQSEVRNGGLHQFFSNSTGVLAPEALEGFRAIGLTTWADVLAEAMRFFGAPYPRDRAERWQALEGISNRTQEESDPFDILDERFFDWLQDESDGWESAADAYAARVSAKQKTRGNQR